MPDYGHDLQFGYFLLPDHHDPPATLKLARELDQLGYDLIGIQDHPYHRDHFDTFALMATILGQTEQVRVFPDVANLPLRPPALLAKTAATLDQLSGGRFELGLGAGAFWQGIEAMGGPNRTPGQAVEALEEAVKIVRRMWSGQRGVRFEGAHYQVHGAQPGPLPAHDMSIWLGVIGPRTMRLAGRIADGWIPSMAYVPPARTVEGNAIIDKGARDASREPSEIRRIYNVSGRFTERAEAPFSAEDKQIVGPAEHWVDVLTHLATEQGFSSFILWTDPEPEALRTFIEDVAPAVREQVAKSRTG